MLNDLVDKKAVEAENFIVILVLFVGFAEGARGAVAVHKRAAVEGAGEKVDEVGWDGVFAVAAACTTLCYVAAEAEELAELLPFQNRMAVYTSDKSDSSFL